MAIVTKGRGGALKASEVSNVPSGGIAATNVQAAINELDTEKITNATHTGEVTGSQALTITSKAVTYAKIQDVSATDKLLGRSSAGAGVIEEITLTAAGRALLDDLTAAAQRATLAVQPTDAPTFTGMHTLSDGQTVKKTTVNAATYSTLVTDYILHVTYTATGACLITIPTAQITDGRKCVIKDAGGNAGTFNITVATQGVETIDGATDYTISGDYSSVTLYSDGTNLFII